MYCSIRNSFSAWVYFYIASPKFCHIQIQSNSWWFYILSNLYCLISICVWFHVSYMFWKMKLFLCNCNNTNHASVSICFALFWQSVSKPLKALFFTFITIIKILLVVNSDFFLEFPWFACIKCQNYIVIALWGPGIY